MKCAIAIFAKSPVRGAVKTRLCPPLTPDQATELYRAFLLDTMHVISEVDGIEPGVLFTSGSGPSPSAGSGLPVITPRDHSTTDALGPAYLPPDRPLAGRALPGCGTAGGPVPPGGLTEREVDVLRLVARGNSNKEIARQLVVSPKTIDNHIQHIYEKLHVSSRAAATLFAVERHLLPELD